MTKPKCDHCGGTDCAVWFTIGPYKLCSSKCRSEFVNTKRPTQKKPQRKPKARVMTFGDAIGRAIQGNDGYVMWGR